MGLDAISAEICQCEAMISAVVTKAPYLLCGIQAWSHNVMTKVATLRLNAEATSDPSNLQIDIDCIEGTNLLVRVQIREAASMLKWVKGLADDEAA